MSTDRDVDRAQQLAMMQQQALAQLQQQQQQQQINNMYAWRSMQSMFGTLPPQGTGPSSPPTKVRAFSGCTKGAEAARFMLASARRRLVGKG